MKKLILFIFTLVTGEAFPASIKNPYGVYLAGSDSYRIGATFQLRTGGQPISATNVNLAEINNSIVVEIGGVDGTSLPVLNVNTSDVNALSNLWGKLPEQKLPSSPNNDDYIASLANDGVTNPETQGSKALILKRIRDLTMENGKLDVLIEEVIKKNLQTYKPLTFIEIANEPNLYPYVSPELYAEHFGILASKIKERASEILRSKFPQHCTNHFFYTTSVIQANTAIKASAITTGLSLDLDIPTGTCHVELAPIIPGGLADTDSFPTSLRKLLGDGLMVSLYGGKIGSSLPLDDLTYYTRFIKKLNILGYNHKLLIDYGNLHFYPIMSSASEKNTFYNSRYNSWKKLVDYVASKSKSKQIVISEFGNLTSMGENDIAESVLKGSIEFFKRDSSIIKQWFWFMGQGEDPKFESLKEALSLSKGLSYKYDFKLDGRISDGTFRDTVKSISQSIIGTTNNQMAKNLYMSFANDTLPIVSMSNLDSVEFFDAIKWVDYFMEPDYNQTFAYASYFYTRLNTPSNTTPGIEKSFVTQFKPYANNKIKFITEKPYDIFIRTHDLMLNINASTSILNYIQGLQITETNNLHMSLIKAKPIKQGLYSSSGTERIMNTVYRDTKNAD